MDNSVEKTRMKFKQDSLSGAVEEMSVDWRGRICNSKHGGMAAAVFVLGLSLSPSSSSSSSSTSSSSSHPPSKCVFLYVIVINIIKIPHYIINLVCIL
ncbi:hypothetical protein OIU79_030894 [Salix purpurea]|uniref:Uncharacterized protein n=1 Tax=Salix purpurea TaxID=77065 RepID=A0A9Q0ZS86_SALPP|nr:hypothetical protein OIU79_030894 [Salix purpurea]